MSIQLVEALRSGMRAVPTALLVSAGLATTPSVSLASERFSFQAQPPVPVGLDLSSLAAGDLDRDGKLDLAVAAYGSVSVLTGNGDGSFQPPVSYPITGYVESVATADLDRNGTPDLVASSWVGDAGGPIASVSVLLGNGDGTFESPIVFTVDAPPAISTAGIQSGSIVVGDFDADAVLDVALVATAPYVMNPQSYVLTLSGTGDGSLGSPAFYPIGKGATKIKAVDFNRDGKTDFAVANFGCGNAHCADDQIAILLGNGDGSLQQATFFPANGSPNSIATGDFDRDGIDDIAIVATTFQPNPLSPTYAFSMALGLGDGTFQVGSPEPMNYVPGDIAAADFDRDGKLDVAMVGSTGSMSILAGNGDGIVVQAVSVPVSVGNGREIVIDDFNHDGKPDISVADHGVGAVVVLINLSGDRVFFDGFDSE